MGPRFRWNYGSNILNMSKHLTLTEEFLVKIFLAIILGFVCFGFFAFAQDVTTTTLPVAVTFSASPLQWILANMTMIVAVFTTMTTIASEAIPMITAKNYGGILELIGRLFSKKT